MSGTVLRKARFEQVGLRLLHLSPLLHEIWQLWQYAFQSGSFQMGACVFQEGQKGKERFLEDDVL